MSRKLVNWRPSRTGLVAGSLVFLGFFLSILGGVWWWGLILTGLGTFGPGLMRELGWLKDQDEFEMQAARRAGYHAFLAAGLIAFLWIAFLRSAPRQLKNPEELATFFAALLWFTWMWSALMAYWGARKTAYRVLMTYGLAWLAFNILSHLRDPLAMVMQCLITTPFFGCAWLSQKRPRVAGILLLVASVCFFILLARIHQQRGLGLVVSAITMTLFIGPLLASGIALLRPPTEETDT